MARTRIFQSFEMHATTFRASDRIPQLTADREAPRTLLSGERLEFDAN